MSIDLTDINIHEGTEASSFIREETSSQNHFSSAKNHEITFTYSGGATAGNYQTTCNVAQMGKTKAGGQFTGTVILSLHDIGLNHFTNWATLFQSKGMEPILEKFTCFHVDFPCMRSVRSGAGRHSGSTGENQIIQTGGDNIQGDSGIRQWDRNLVYPSLEELAQSMVPAILQYFNLHSVILFGCGVGSNVALRFSLKNPSNVVGLISVNPIHYAVGWSEWIWDKTGTALTNDKLREKLLDYLFTPHELANTAGDLVRGTDQAIKQMDQEALLGFYNSFKSRSPIILEKPIVPADSRKPNVLSVPICIVIGDWASGFMEDAMELNSLIDPKISNFVKLADAGAMVYEEQPTKVAESIKLFLQGLGYLSTILPTRLHEQNQRRAEKLSKASIDSGRLEGGGFGDMADMQTTRFNNDNTVNNLI